MEGPSLFLAAEQLAPFIGMKIQKVEGNTKIGKERFIGQKVLSIFSWGKHLVFQFEDFALRVHFMLWGSFEATINKIKVTGDYPRKNRASRLSFFFSNGSIEMYSCSLKFIESSNAKEEYDFSVDVMSSEWNGKKALERVLLLPKEEIGDVLLDQTIFSGVGNIIKNEVLYLEKKSPTELVRFFKKNELQSLIKTVREYVFQFLKWRRAFELKKHYQIYRQSFCPNCHQKVIKKKTGLRKRFSYICPNCQNP